MTDVFISYAREDRLFVQRLHDALAKDGHEAWVDWEGIPASAMWMAEVRAAIDEADCFCFVISPDSVESPVCREEAAHAAASNKRVLPLLHRPVDDGLVPETVAVHNWISFDGQLGFDHAFAELVAALETEPEHLRAHTRLLVRAKEWDASGRERSSLLRGSDLTQAEAWLDSSVGKQPAATPLHTAYVLASRKAAARRQRTGVAAVAIALVFSLILSGVALVQRSQARDAQARAEKQAAESRSGQLGALSLLRASDDPELALLLAVEAAKNARTGTAETALRTAIAASHLETSVPEPGSGTALGMSADGSTLIVGSVAVVGSVVGITSGLKSGYLTIRRPEDLSEVAVHNAGEQTAVVPDIAVDPQGRFIAAATDLASVLIVDPETADVEDELFFPFLLGRAQLAVSSDGRRLLIAGEDGVAWVRTDTWELADPIDISGSSGPWRDVAVDRSGRWAALSGRSSTYVVAAGGGSPARRLSTDGASSLSFDDSGETLVGGFKDAALVWDAATGRQIQRIPATDVTAIALSHDGSTLLTASGDGQAAFWNVATGSLIASLVGAKQSMTGAAFDPSGSRAYTTGADGITREWRVPSGTLPLATEPVVAQSGGGTVIATSGPGGLTFRDAETGAVLSSVAGEPAGCTESVGAARPRVRLSADGTRALTVFGDDCLIAFEVGRDEPMWVHDLGEDEDATFDPEPDMWLSSDGEVALVSLFMSAGIRTTGIRLIDLATGEAVWNELTGDGHVFDADFSIDGATMFLAGRFGPIRGALYDVEAGTQRCTADAPGAVNDVAAIPGGGFALATDSGVQLLDIACKSQQVGELTARGAPVAAIAFRDDGALAATVGDDDIVRFWDAATGTQLAQVPAIAEDIAFTDGGELLIGGPGGARRYACEMCGTFDELLATARQRLTRQLTAVERATYLTTD